MEAPHGDNIDWLTSNLILIAIVHSNHHHYHNLGCWEIARVSIYRTQQV